ncbi:MAG: hypothetical protein WDZ49_15285 [Litorilinea sp.]
MPKMHNFIVEHAAADGPYGAKGVGEISPTITNAIFNAVGVRVLDLPVHQNALLLAMQHNVPEIDRCWGVAP